MATKVKLKDAALTNQIEQLYLTRQKRLDLNKQAEALKVEEQMLKEMVIKSLKGQSLTEFSTGTFVAELRMKSVPSVADWDALYLHITKTQEWDLIHRRVTETAVRARWEAGDDVPGVARTDVLDLSIGKARGV